MSFKFRTASLAALLSATVAEIGAPSSCAEGAFAPATFGADTSGATPRMAMSGHEMP